MTAIKSFFFPTGCIHAMWSYRQYPVYTVCLLCTLVALKDVTWCIMGNFTATSKNVTNGDIINPVVLKLGYCGRSRSMQLLLTTWLLLMTDHQHLLYCFCRKNGLLSSFKQDNDYPQQGSDERWQKLEKYIFVIPKIKFCKSGVKEKLLGLTMDDTL